jgi:subtilisin family serine protease
MTEEERARIVSEDYADLIINYSNNPFILQQIPNATVHIMNEAYAVIHIPVAQFTSKGIVAYGYPTIPYLCGLASEVSVEASGISELRMYPGFNLRGQGVLVGIVDTGINYNLPVFRKPDGTTKVAAIWDQTVQTGPSPFNTDFGTEYRSEQINQAIYSQNPLDIVPSTDDNGHGTMLAGVAVGTENRSEDFAGVAPDADLVVVKLSPAKKYLRDFYLIREGVVCYQENSIMWGVQYCIQVARQLNRPISICIGIGTSQDAHDGYSSLGSFLSILADFPKTGIVTAIGNEGNNRRHFQGIIDPTSRTSTVEMNIGEEDKAFTMELWGDAPGIYSIDILSPAGEYIPRIPPSLRVSREISFIFEETVIMVEYKTVESLTGDQLILFRFRNTTPGIWRFTVYGQSNFSTGFHIWLPMGDFISRQTYFIQANIYTTVIAPGSAAIPITVTAYNPVSGTLYVNASRGYTRSNKVKPELAAPGVNYKAPNLTGGFQNFSGTGVASAHATGVVALALEWGVVLGNQPNLDTIEIKNYLIRGAKRSGNMAYPNRDWGYGMIDLFSTYNAMRINL